MPMPNFTEVARRSAPLWEGVIDVSRGIDQAFREYWKHIL